MRGSENFVFGEPKFSGPFCGLNFLHHKLSRKVGRPIVYMMGGGCKRILLPALKILVASTPHPLPKLMALQLWKGGSSLSMPGWNPAEILCLWCLVIYAWVKPGRDIVLMVFSFLLIYAWVKPGRDIVLVVFSFLLHLLLLLLFLLLKTFLCSPVTQKLK